MYQFESHVDLIYMYLLSYYLTYTKYYMLVEDGLYIIVINTILMICIKWFIYFTTCTHREHKVNTSTGIRVVLLPYLGFFCIDIEMHYECK